MAVFATGCRDGHLLSADDLSTSATETPELYGRQQRRFSFACGDQRCWPVLLSPMADLLGSKKTLVHKALSAELEDVPGKPDSAQADRRLTLPAIGGMPTVGVPAMPYEPGRLKRRPMSSPGRRLRTPSPPQRQARVTSIRQDLVAQVQLEVTPAEPEQDQPTSRSTSKRRAKRATTFSTKEGASDQRAGSAMRMLSVPGSRRARAARGADQEAAGAEGDCSPSSGAALDDEIAEVRMASKGSRASRSKSKGTPSKDLEYQQEMALQALIFGILTNRLIRRTRQASTDGKDCEQGAAIGRRGARSETQPAVGRSISKQSTNGSDAPPVSRSISKQSTAISEASTAVSRSISKQTSLDQPAVSKRSSLQPPVLGKRSTSSSEGGPTPRRKSKANTFAAPVGVAAAARLSGRDTPQSEPMSARSSSIGAAEDDEKASPRRVAEIVHLLIKDLMFPDNTKVFQAEFAEIYDEVQEVLRSQAAGELHFAVAAAVSLEGSAAKEAGGVDLHAAVALVMMVLRVLGPRHNMYFEDLMPQVLFWHRRSPILLDPAFKKAMDDVSWCARARPSPNGQPLPTRNVVDSVEQIFSDITAPTGNRMCSRQWHRVQGYLQECPLVGGNVKRFESHTLFYVGTHKNGEASYGLSFRRFRSALMSMAEEMQVHPHSIFAAIARHAVVNSNPAG